MKKTPKITLNDSKCTLRMVMAIIRSYLSIIASLTQILGQFLGHGRISRWLVCVRAQGVLRYCLIKVPCPDATLVFIPDGSSEYDAHAWSDIKNLRC